MDFHKIKILKRRLKKFSATLPALTSHYRHGPSQDEVVSLLEKMGLYCQPTSNLLITENAVAVIFADAVKYGPVVIKASINDRSSDALSRNYLSLEKLAAHPLLPTLVTPRPVFRLSSSHRSAPMLITVETRIQGESAADALYSDAWQKVQHRCFLSWKQQISIAEHDDAVKHETVSRYLSDFRRFFEAHAELSQMHAILNFLEAKAASGAFNGLHVGPVHGDYWLGNLLLLDDDRIGIVDWEAFLDFGISDLDLLHLLLYSHAQRLHISLATAWRQFMIMDSRDIALLTANSYALKPFKLLLILYWLNFLTTRPWSKRAGWLTQMVVSPLDFISDLIRKELRV
jgi:hypothetical protein